ncbi:MAG: hypothetical protein BWK75_06990 [Candidatus Altiarchaeales archaeon A3]|nr:MAG: hypothetical protein BWK75_06990 [Candidatus Altiarchaeales archaeon A3]
MIRAVKSDDLKTIVEIYNSYQQNFEFPIDELFLIYSLNNKNFKIFVLDDNIINGFCGIYFYPDSSAEIGPIGVDENFLNQHIGTSLLNYVLNFAKENNAEKCIARVLDKNFNAINFFKKNKFVAERVDDLKIYFVKYLI